MIIFLLNKEKFNSEWICLKFFQWHSLSTAAYKISKKKQKIQKNTTKVLILVSISL